MAKKKTEQVQEEVFQNIEQTQEVQEQSEVLKPEIIEAKEVNPEDKFSLKPGECVIKVVKEGKDHGKLFKTTLKMAQRSFHDPEKYQMVKKN